MKTRAACTLFLLSLTASLGAKDLPKALLVATPSPLATPRRRCRPEGKVQVIHHKGNAQHTGTGLKMLNSWVGETQWDVIHFNWGLWDLCYHLQSKEQGQESGTSTP